MAGRFPLTLPKSRIARAGLALTGLLVTVILCIALTLFLPATRQQLLDSISAAVSGPDFKLEIHGLDFGKTWTLNHLTLADEHGSWLRAHDIRIKPHLLPLLGGRMLLDEISVQRLTLERLPQSETQEESSAPPALPSITVRALHAPYVHIGQPVLGQQADIMIEGNVDVTPESLRGHLLLARLDRDDSAELQTEFRPQTRHLEAALTVRENPAGLLHVLLGAEGKNGISMHMHGSGDLNNWPARLQADLADLGSLTMNATLAMAERSANGYRLEAAALLQPGPSLATRMGRRIPQTHLNLNMHQHGDRIVAEHFQMTNLWGDVEANATMELDSTRLQAQLLATAGDLRTLLPENLQAGPASVNATVTIADGRLHVQTGSTLQRWSFSDFPVDTADMNATIEAPLSFTTWDASGRINALLPALPQGLQNCTADMRISGAESGLHLRQMDLHTSTLDLGLTGSLTDTIRLTSDIALRNQPLWTEGPVISALGTATVHGKAAGNSYTGDLAMNLNRVTGLPEIAADLLGAQSGISASLTLQEDSLSITALTFKGNTTGTGSARLNFTDSRYTAQTTLHLPDLDLGPVHLNKNTRLKADMHGTGDVAQIDAVAEAPELSLPGLPLQALRAQARIQSRPSGLTATLAGSAQAHAEPLHFDLNTDLRGQTLHVPKASLQLAGTSLQAQAEVQLERGAATGQADLTSTDLSLLGRMAGLSMTGTMTGRATLDADRGLHLRLDADSLSAGSVQTEHLELEATSSLQTNPPLSARLLAGGLAYGGTDLGRLNGTLSGRASAPIFTVQTHHTHHDVVVAGLAELTGPETRFTIKDISGHIASQQLGLDGPLVITRSTDSLRWSQATLHAGNAQLTTSGNLSSNSALSDSSLTALDPSLFRALQDDLPRTDISGSAAIRGTLTAPDVHMELRAQDLHVADTDFEAMPPVSTMTDLRWKNGRLASSTSISGPSKTMTANASLALPLTGTLFSPVLDQHAPLDGAVQTSMNLSLIPHLLRLDDQIMSGTASANLRISGTLDSPRLHGSGTVSAGRYENFRTGSRVENLHANLMARDARIDLAFNATDGAQGKMTGTGNVDMAGRTYEQEVHFEKFRAVGLDLVTSTASGDLQVHGSPEGLSVDGNLVVDPTQVRLPNATPAGVTRIDIAEINTGRPVKAVSRKKGLTPALDIRVKVPARLFVNGRGLDSEWNGQVHVTGTGTAPKLTGQMQILRGKFDFLDRTFDLTRGVLTLDGATPPNPFLDITGETTIQDITVLVQILGPASNFHLTLSSTPSLPQDELLAMILFGRSMRQISPLQAIQLAQAASALTGVGQQNGLEFFDKLKSSLGLREVEVGKDDDDNTSIGIGGYVGGKYYVRTQRTVSGEDRTRVEIQLTPQVSVETEMGADSKNGGGVVWKHDY